MTAADYLAQAISRSYRNRGNVLAQDVTECLARLSLQFRRYYALSAGLGSAALAKLAAVPATTSPTRWALPTDCDTVHFIEQGTTPVYVVTYEDRRETEPSEACVYRLGRTLYPAGNSTDPSAASLLVLYTPVPADFATTASTAPTDWNPNFDPFVVVELALWLAKKDGRPEDVAALEPEYADWEGLFEEWLGRNTIPLTKRFQMPVQVPSTRVKAVEVK